MLNSQDGGRAAASLPVIEVGTISAILLIQSCKTIKPYWAFVGYSLSLGSMCPKHLRFNVKLGLRL